MPDAMGVTVSLAGTRLDEVSPCLSRALSDTGMQKIVAFEKQRFSRGLCQGVSETISKVQPGGVAASATEIAVSFTRDFRLLLGYRLDGYSSLSQQIVETAALQSDRDYHQSQLQPQGSWPPTGDGDPHPQWRSRMLSPPAHPAKWLSMRRCPTIIFGRPFSS